MIKQRILLTFQIMKIRNISPISKTNCDANEKIESNFLFMCPFSYNYDEKEKVTKKFNELHGR